MLLDQLKTETARPHAQLEANLGLAANADEHERQLRLFFGFIAAHEARLVELLGTDDPIVAERSKTAWLAADLAHFGWDRERIAALPRPELPRLRNRLEALGVAYVIEGSTLGGQFISRHLEATLGFKEGRGYRYFQSYGPAVRAQWQAFREELMQSSSPENDAVIVAAARGCFEQLEAWFGLQGQMAA